MEFVQMEFVQMPFVQMPFVQIDYSNAFCLNKFGWNDQLMFKMPFDKRTFA